MTSKFRRNAVILFILSGINFINTFKEIVLYSVLRELGYLENPQVVAKLGWGEGSIMLLVSSALFLVSFASLMRSLTMEIVEDDYQEKTEKEMRIEQHKRAKEGRDFLLGKEEDNDKDD